QSEIQSLQKSHQMRIKLLLKPLEKFDDSEIMNQKIRHNLSSKLLDQATLHVRGLELSTEKKETQPQQESDLFFKHTKLKGIIARSYHKIGKKALAKTLLKPVLKSSIKLISAIDKSITNNKKQGKPAYQSVY